MKHFSELISKFLQKQGLNKEAYASLILEKTRIILSDHFGDEVFQFCTVKKYQNKKVFISTTSSSWKQTLHSHSSSFLLLIQSEFPKEKIKEIIVH
ncbi:TPA: DUF721 domain-containing protein [Candidatus Gracilibacteria bacterium]|nr:DUF721 domain-containing protein [Candidatus Peregrinibacteria bacterium]HIQ56925.1 DUF721 domain-containing protein [Candidatus Gracilibacteria bacterium]HIQ57593.1 DUF721 domain-containing protein [Candidatus Gracilibacteria bacterium]